MKTELLLETVETECLRELARRVAEIAADPIQQQKTKLWTAHNDLKPCRPMVFIDPENGWNECITSDLLHCKTPLAREWEMVLKKQIFWFEQLKDDKVILPYFDLPHSFTDTGWGVSIAKEGGDNSGAYKIKQAISDYEYDFEQIHYPQIVLDYAKSERLLELAHSVFDGILTVRQRTNWWWSLGLTADLIQLRGIEDFLFDLIDEPEWVHRFMRLLCDGVLHKLDFLQEKGLLAQNTTGCYVGSGGFGDTTALLPTTTGQVTCMDMWGFVESQETSSVNPEMYGEFIFPYHKEITDRFGLNCYGCCEAYNGRWKYVKQLSRLRRVSVSPWASLEQVQEQLGKNYIASIKLNPAHLGQHTMDDDLVRKEISTALQLSRGCVPELIMKDNHTLGGQASHATRWVQLVREEIERL